MSAENENGGGLDFGSIDFTPAWVRKDAGVSVGRFRPDGDDRSAGAGGRDGRRPSGDRKPFGDRRPQGGFGGGERGGRRPSGDRRPFGGGDRRPRFEERPRPLDCEVRILPETKALGTIIRKLQGDSHAYKLKDLAYFFLDNPESILLKITPRAPQGAAGRDASGAHPNAVGRDVPGAHPNAVGRDVPGAPCFFQCKACGFASTREEDVVSHALAAHLADYYDAKEIDCEPPKGTFSCVAKCGLSGVLLGPPNVHEFNSVVREMIRTRYPQMSEEQYRSHIEMVRDADAIEEWRKGATKKTVYFAKGQSEVEGAASLSREQAEGEFRRAILPSLVERPKSLTLTADVALKSPVKPLVWAVNDAIAAERRAPSAMCFALRGAFHHRKLRFFRANDARGQEFVSGVEYKPFDADHAIPELAQAARFVADHPCCDKSEFPADVPDFEKHVNWLASTGHVVAFTNGVFSAVEKYPKYGPQWKKRKVEKLRSGEVEKPEDGAVGRVVPDAPQCEAAGRGVPDAPQCEAVGRGVPDAPQAEAEESHTEARSHGDEENNPCESEESAGSVDENSGSEEEVKKDEAAPVVAE